MLIALYFLIGLGLCFTFWRWLAEKSQADLRTGVFLVPFWPLMLVMLILMILWRGIEWVFMKVCKE